MKNNSKSYVLTVVVHMHHCRVAKHPKISEIIQIIVLLFELYILKHIIFILKPIIC